MMDDQDLETRLTAYRPAGPPPELREVVIAAASSHGPGPVARVLTGWLPIAAAVAATILFYWFAAAERQRLFAQLSPASVEQSIDVDGEVRR